MATRLQLGRSLVILLIALIGGTSSIAAAQSGFSVSVRVAAWARIEAPRVPESIEVTKEDIARGYVALAEPVSFLLKSNDPAGSRLVVQLGDEFEGAALRGRGTEAFVSGREGWIRLPFDGLSTRHELQVVLELDPATLPGTYRSGLAFEALTVSN